MSRLSLRIFVSFFAAMLVIGAGAILITFWVFTERQEDNSALLREVAGQAAAALARDGRAGLRDWLATEAEGHADRPVLVIDDAGLELLGRARCHRASGPGVGRPGARPLGPCAGRHAPAA